MLQTTSINLTHLGPIPNHDLDHPAKISVEDVSFWYGAKQALKHVSLEIFKNEVTAFIGPSGCGKTTLLRCLNRTNEIIEHTRMEGRILLDGEDIYAPEVDPPLLRSRFGWIAQRPNPFPKSIRANIAYGPKISGTCGQQAGERRVGRSLAARGRIVGRGQGSLARARPGPIGRPAAKAVHRARHSDASRSDPDG